MPKKAENYAGLKYNSWTILRRSSEWRPKKRLWVCQCSCGTVATRFAATIRNGSSKSCGKCRYAYSYEPEYHRWRAMIQRCTHPANPAYPRYGGRGIKVCERWMNFENFVSDMGPKPSGTELDRIDNDGPYSPQNCRWATRRTNSNNRRNNRYITINGVTRTLAEWSIQTGIGHRTIATRLDRGDSPESAIRPVRR